MTSGVSGDAMHWQHPKIEQPFNDKLVVLAQSGVHKQLSC